MEHAALAGELADAWGGEAAPIEPRDPVAWAARWHDAGWLEPDAEPPLCLETGRPHDYRTTPLPDHLRIARRSVARTAAADPYAGWLVSRHFASFYDGESDAAAAEWVAEQVEERGSCLTRSRPRVAPAALDPRVLESNFDRLQLFDGLSLALCEAWREWTSRQMATVEGERGCWRYGGREAGAGPLQVEGRVAPWPFASPRVELEVRARRVEGEEWETASAWSRAWRTAEAVGVRMTLVPA